MFDTVFQITYFKIWKNVIVCLICVCVFFFLSNKNNAILFKEREKERKKKSLVLSIGLTIFNLFTRRPLNNVIWKLKTSIISFQNTCFKHPKLRTITQTFYQT